MWSPTTQTTENTTTETTSDNKNKEEVENCRCSSATPPADVAVVGAAGSSIAQQQQLQQQKVNVFENIISKDTKSTFGGNLPTEDSDNDATRDKEDYCGSETVDSGFISGPQSSPLYREQEDDELGNDHGIVGGTATAPVHKFNIKPDSRADGTNASGANFKKTLIDDDDKTDIVPDSGCIDEIEEDEEEEKLQVTHDQSIGAVETATSATVANTNTVNQKDSMLFKQNVDAGMSEWFCQMRLQNDAANPLASTSSAAAAAAAQQQQQLASAGLNNLDGSGRKSSNIAAVPSTTSTNQNVNSNKTQQAAGNTANMATSATATAATTTSTITPSNAWEQFYQQNDDGDTPLHLACISGYADVVAALIRMAPHPCLFNIQNDEAQTPLHLAALTTQPNILRMLLLAGAEPTIRDRHGNTALHLACSAGEKQCVRALTETFGASEIHEAHRQYGHRSNDKALSSLSYARLPSDLEIRNYDGERCVHLAAQAGHIDILRILVSHGADINAREGKSGRTPLHIAIECCNEDLANFLLDECEKLNLETATYAGLTAYQVACILNKSQMQNILKRRGAEPLTPPESDYDSSDIDSDLDDTEMYDRFGDPKYFVSYNGGNPMTVA